MVEDVERLSKRKVFGSVDAWKEEGDAARAIARLRFTHGSNGSDRSANTDAAEKLQRMEYQAIANGSDTDKLKAPDRSRLERLKPGFGREHNPFLRHIIRRTRDFLETEKDPETNQPYLDNQIKGSSWLIRL